MNTRTTNYITTAAIVISLLFLVFYVLAVKTTLFTSQGSLLNQGYVQNGTVKLNNIAVGAFALLIMAVVANFIVVREPHKTHRIRRVGVALLMIAVVWFLYVGVMIVRGLLSGHFLD